MSLMRRQTAIKRSGLVPYNRLVASRLGPRRVLLRLPPALPPTEAAQVSRAPSDVDLAQEMVKMTVNESVYLANVRALEAANGMLGTLLDTQA